jgi:hypothetical protein
MMSSVSLTPRAPVRLIVSFRGVINLISPYFAIQETPVKTRARWFRVKGRVQKPKYPLMEPQPVATVSYIRYNLFRLFTSFQQVAKRSATVRSGLSQPNLTRVSHPRHSSTNPEPNKPSTFDVPSASRPSLSESSFLSRLESMPTPTENTAKTEDDQSNPILGLPPIMPSFLRTCVPETFSTCNLTTCTTREVMKKLQEVPFGQRPPTPYALS